MLNFSSISGSMISQPASRMKNILAVYLKDIGKKDLLGSYLVLCRILIDDKIDDITVSNRDELVERKKNILHEIKRFISDADHKSLMINHLSEILYHHFDWSVTSPGTNIIKLMGYRHHLKISQRKYLSLIGRISGSNLNKNRILRAIFTLLNGSGITHLDLGSNQLKSFSPFDFKNNFRLLKFSGLTTLSLNCDVLCSLSDGQWDALFSVLKNSYINSLYLRENGLFNWKGIKWRKFFSGLKESGITKVDLCDNALWNINDLQWRCFLSYVKGSGVSTLTINYLSEKRSIELNEILRTEYIFKREKTISEALFFKFINTRELVGKHSPHSEIGYLLRENIIGLKELNQFSKDDKLILAIPHVKRLISKNHFPVSFFLNLSYKDCKTYADKPSPLNGLEKSIIDGTINFYMEDIIESLAPHEAEAVMLKIVSQKKLKPEMLLLLEKKDILVSFNEIRRILNHRCPQNRASGNFSAFRAGFLKGRMPVTPEEIKGAQTGIYKSTVYFYEGDFGSKVSTEPEGLLGLTDRVGPKPARHKLAVVYHIVKRITNAIEQLKKPSSSIGSHGVKP